MTKKKSRWVWVVVPLCLLPHGFAVADKPQDSPRVRSANDLWAEAVWLSLPPNDASTEDVAAKFTAALALAEKKAPIYVSFGDSDSGPNRVQDVFRELVTTGEKAFKREFDAQLAESLKIANVDPEVAKQLLPQIVRDSLQKSYEAVGKNEELTGKLAEMAQNMGEATDSSIALYLAAVAEDPAYKPAWFRLAKYADERLATVALDGFAKADPNNATVDYMRAIRHLESERLDLAFKFVEAGNRKPSCRWYSSELPGDFTLAYPDNEQTRKAGVAGQPLTATALRNLTWKIDELYSWADPLQRGLRQLAYDFIDEATRLQKEGKPNDAAAYVDAVRELGLHIMLAEPRNWMWASLGSRTVAMTSDFEPLFEQLSQPERLTDFRQSQQVRRRFTDELLKSLPTRQPKDGDVELLLLGKRDFLREENVAVEAALKTSGLLEFRSRRDSSRETNPAAVD